MQLLAKSDSLKAHSDESVSKGAVEWISTYLVAHETVFVAACGMLASHLSS